MYIDSHCHLDMEPLSLDLEEVIRRASKNDVAKIINIGSSIRGSRASVDLANNYPHVWASVGLHPHDAETVMDIETVMGELEALAQNNKVVAIGEIGLDYFDLEGKLTQKVKEAQKELFVAQLKLAEKLKLPVVFHVRDAWDDFFSILNNFKSKNSNSGLAGVVHCFTGDREIVKKCLNEGLYIGFTGFVTFEQAKFDSIREAARVVPLDRILVETDAPFLAPEPHRGKTNEPAFVVEVAKKIANLKDVGVSEIEKSVEKNCKLLFNI